jgi:hypothetical protein
MCLNLSSSKFSQRVAGVERSEPPDPGLSGGSLALDPGHPNSSRPNLELLNLGMEPGRPGKARIPWERRRHRSNISLDVNEIRRAFSEILG